MSHREALSRAAGWTMLPSNGRIPNMTPKPLQLNAVSTNAVSTNAVSTNAVSTNAVSTNAVSTNAVSTDAVPTTAMWIAGAVKSQVVLSAAVPRIINFQRGALIVRFGTVSVALQMASVSETNVGARVASEEPPTEWSISQGEMLVRNLSSPVRLFLSAGGPQACVEVVHLQAALCAADVGTQPNATVTPHFVHAVAFGQVALPLTICDVASTSAAGRIAELLFATAEPQQGAHLLAALFYEFATQRHLGRGLLEPSNDETTDAIVARAVRLLELDLSRAWTLNELSRTVGSSRAALVRRFRQSVGEPPLRFLTHLRMLKAAELVLQSNASLSTIARQVGYESEFALSRAFKRFHGVSPAAYRYQYTTPQRTALRPLACAA